MYRYFRVFVVFLIMLISDIVSMCAEVFGITLVNELWYTSLFTVAVISIWLWNKRNLQPYKCPGSLFPALSTYGNIFVLYFFFIIFMLHALKNRLAVKIEKSDSISCFDIKYFTLRKSAVLNLGIKVMPDKRFISVMGNLYVKYDVVDWPFIFSLP